MPPRETGVTKRILEGLNSLPGCMARKLHGSAYSVVGDPDIYGCINGRMFQFEVKAPGAKADKDHAAKQAWEQRKWREAGAIVAQVTSWKEVQEILKEAP